MKTSIPKLFFALGTMMCSMLLITCSTKELRTGEGFLPVDGGKVWYRVVGSGDKTPILVLHGGPGAPSYYLKPLTALATDRKIIFFDQLGCGKSDRITDTTLMNVAHYVEEVKSIVDQLGLKEFYLLGQSWGTMLGTDYYLKYPEGIKALIFCSPAISIPRWIADADSLIKTMPDSIQSAIRTHETAKTYSNPAYQQAVAAYYQRYVAVKLPWSADMDSTSMGFGANYAFMWGPSEFTATGALKTYDRTNRLGEIKVPTLFICGEFDEASPRTVKYYQGLVPGSKLEIIPAAAHLTMQDNPEANNKAVADFLSGLEK